MMPQDKEQVQRVPGVYHVGLIPDALQLAAGASDCSRLKLCLGAGATHITTAGR